MASRCTGANAPMSSPNTPPSTLREVRRCWCRHSRAQILSATRLSPLSSRKSEAVLRCASGTRNSCAQHAATTPSHPSADLGGAEEPIFVPVPSWRWPSAAAAASAVAVVGAVVGAALASAARARASVLPVGVLGSSRSSVTSGGIRWAGSFRPQSSRT